MIRERHRIEILHRLKLMRRHKSLYEKSKENFIAALREAYEDDASPSHDELGKLVGLSRQRITNILRGE